MLQVKQLWCEHDSEPMGIGVRRPRLGWRLLSDKQGVHQIAYQIESRQWNSGRVESDQSTFIEFGASNLSSRERVEWRVRAWDNHGEFSEWSDWSSFEVGLLEPSDWSAKWIGGDRVGGPQTTSPCPYLRKAFRIEKPVASARLYATALGLYQFSLDGKRIGNDELTPGWTDYHSRVLVQAYAVEGLHQGEHVLSAKLGDGWYAGHVEWRGRQRYGDRPKLFAQFEINFEDGTRETIATDETWQVVYGGMIESDLLMGESFDARHEPKDWQTTIGDSGLEPWHSAIVFPSPEIELTMADCRPVRTQEVLKPIEIRRFGEWSGTRFIVDFGQNLVGRVRIRAKGPAGQTITLRHAEVLDDKGQIYTANLRSAKQTDHWTLADDGNELYEPTFTFKGFRYVEVKGYPGELGTEDIEAIVLHSDLDSIGTFACSDPLLTQLQHNIEWGWKGNSVDIPTDCPQRDERLGWTGDAQVFVRTAAFFCDVRAFFARWQRDLEDSQGEDGAIPPVAPHTGIVSADGGPAWSDAVVICPYVIYRCTGDPGILKTHYASMKAFLGYLEKTSQDHIRCYPEYPHFKGFGDWLSINAETPHDLIGTAYFAYSAKLLSEIATALGESGDAQTYQKLFEEVREAFQRRFVTAEGLVHSGTQTALVLALHFDLLPEHLRSSAMVQLVRDIRGRGNHLSTGFVGSSYLPHVLSDGEQWDVVFDLLLQKSWPSWLYAVTQGATTIWERWDGWTHDKGFQDPGMNSFNHYAYGAIGSWMYQVLAGIDLHPEVPGYRKFVIRPHVGGGIEWVKAKHTCLFGDIRSEWSLESGEFVLTVEVPVGTEAEVVMPFSGSTHAVVSGVKTFREPIQS